MKNKVKDKLKYKLAIALMTMVFLFSSVPCHPAKADFWTAAQIAALLEVSMTEIFKQIQNALVGSLKQAALQTINDTVNNSVSQGKGGKGPMFVTNWEDFLVNETKKEADLYMNDFFSQLTSGRGSSSYTGSSGGSSFMGSAKSSTKVAGASAAREGVVAGDSITAGDYSLGSISGNYQNLLVNEGKKATTEASIPGCGMTTTSGMFNGADWSQFSNAMGVDTCNRFGFVSISQSTYSNVTSKKTDIAKTQVQAYQGFLPAKSGDSVITPGSTIAAIQAQAEDLGNKILAGANSMPEVITSLVSRLATKTIQQGIGQAQSYVQKEINSKKSNYSQQKNSQTDLSKKYKSSY